MSEFVICINNDNNPASLIVGKVYRTLSDPAAEAHHMLRVIDEDRSETDGYLLAWCGASLRTAVRSQCLVRGTLQIIDPANTLLEIGQQVPAIRCREREVGSRCFL